MKAVEQGGPGDPPSPHGPPVTRPPISAEVVWAEQLRFDASSGEQRLTVDGDNVAGMPPMKLVAVGLASCMAIDVLAILQKGRHVVRGLTVSLTGERTSGVPRRFERISLRVTVTGSVPKDAVERAVELSRDKYCSVWQSMRQDIALTTTVDLAD